MIHKHHIKPQYEGGSNDPSNLVLLTPLQHAMWHYAEWTRKGNWKDKLAFKSLVAQIRPGDVALETEIKEIRDQLTTKKTKKPRPEEVRKKISASVKAYHESQGRKKIKKQRGRKSKPIELKSPCGQFAFVFNSAKEAGEALGLWDGNITKVARGEWTHTGGWAARYI
jgi:hypothetical protein